MDNLRLNDEAGTHAVHDELKLFKTCSGGYGTIVDKSSRLNRDIPRLRTLSQSTGVNIIIGTGILLYIVYIISP